MRRWIAPVVVLVAIAVFIIATAGPPAPTPNPPGTFSFAVLGDAPYYAHEELQYRIVRKDLDQNDLAFVIHVGDIFWRPCSDAMYAQSRKWIDCWEPRVGGYDPLDRLAVLRRTFYDHPTRSLGSHPIALASQKALAENARWHHGSLVFATVHLIGSKNGMIPFPTRTPAYDAESRQRTAACAAWLRETFADARSSNATTVVIAFHANPDFERVDGDYRDAYQPFLSTLEDEARRFPGSVLVVQGDDHEFIVDHPFPTASNLTRMQVPGSPDVGWVRVNVKPGGKEFTFQNRVVAGWKYW